MEKKDPTGTLLDWGVSCRLGTPVLGPMWRRQDPCLLVKMLEKIEDMEKPRLHLWGVHGCLFASRQGRESSTLAAASSPHSPIQSGQTQQPHSLHAMTQGLGQPGPRNGSDLVIHRWPRDLGSDP